MDTANKKANKGLAAMPDGAARRVQLNKAHTARRREDKEVIAAGVADSQDTRFIPIGGQTIYREEEVAALEMAKLYQDLFEIQYAEMMRDCMLSRDIYFDDAEEDHLWN